ncbi:hypothetical protein ANRL1_00218 [Anaerolineae bacterium]|nr:hypothetical protein ANRL1_00218 [Anaerolineae bacterium]
MQRLFELFATLLDYPSSTLADAAKECATLLTPQNSEASNLLRDFQELAASTDLGRMEEIYTGFFELNAVSHPYVGYHLFGETYKRSVFLLGLKERYAAHNFAHGAELADHLVVMLRFIAVSQDAELVGELVRDALLPALEKMSGEPAENEPAEEEPVVHQHGRAGYQQLLRALQLSLQAIPQAMIVA